MRGAALRDHEREPERGPARGPRDRPGERERRGVGLSAHPTEISRARENGSGGSLGIRAATYSYNAGLKALDSVDLALEAGQVHGLVGQNGCGKSTLIKLLTGALRPQHGAVYVDGQEVSFASPAQAAAAGIGVVHQDYNLFPDLSIAQNVVGVAGGLRRKRIGLVDRRRMEAEVANMLHSFGIDLAPETKVRALDPAEMKFVEIVRAMRASPRFLVLDEPTASLEPHTSERVLDLLRRLGQTGVGVCFISHRLREVISVCDRISVLRDGRLVASAARGELDIDGLARLIVGPTRAGASASAASGGPGPSDRDAEIALRARGLKLRAGQPGVDLDVGRGEILGLTGLLGSGAGTVVRMLGGAEPLRGTVEVGGRVRRLRDPRDAERLGIGFIPENRKTAGSVADLSVAANISLASLEQVSRFGLLRHGQLRERAREYAQVLEIKAPSIEAPVRTLSGGNLQKVLIAKWLASKARILAIEEPTHGVDIGAKAQIHDLLRRYVEQGGSIVVSVSEVEEALQLCDRLAIFRDGALISLDATHALTEADVTVLAAAPAD